LAELDDEPAPPTTGETEVALGMIRLKRHGPAAALHQQKGSSLWQIRALGRFNAVLRQSCLRVTDKYLMR
jgi:hypothetical protein